MKFFNLILISSFLTQRWVYPDDALSTLVPSHRLYSLYSMRHSLLPRNVDPSTSSLMLEIPAAKVSKSFPSISSQARLCSTKGDILREYEHDLYSLLPSVSEHSLHCISELPNLYIVIEHLLSIHGIGTWSPIQYVLKDDLHYGSSFYSLPYCKSMKFIETKVSAINCRVLTLS